LSEIRFVGKISGMEKEDNIKFDDYTGQFLGESEQDKEHWKEQYPYLDDFGRLIMEAAQYLATRLLKNPYIISEVKKDPRGFLERYFRRENFLLMPTPSGNQIKLKQCEIKTPSELYDFIESLFEAGLTKLNKKLSNPNSEPFAKEGYNIALGYAIKLHNSNPKLPELPRPTSDPITDLRLLQEWCIEKQEPAETRQANSEKLVEDLVRSMRKELKDLRIIDRLRELQPLWKRAKPKRWEEFTEDEQKALGKEQAEHQQEYEREQRLLKVKRFLQSIIDAKSDAPNSKLFITAEELLEFVVQYETNPSSVSNCEWNRFETILVTRCEALLKAEIKAQQEHSDREAEIDRNTKTTIYAIIIIFMMILIFVLLVHIGPLSWFKNHPNSYSLQGSIICLIPCLLVGLFKPQWRKWCWGVAGLAFLGIVLSLLGGNSRQSL
jgi:hypothetical protein